MTVVRPSKGHAREILLSARRSRGLQDGKIWAVQIFLWHSSCDELGPDEARFVAKSARVGLDDTHEGLEKLKIVRGAHL
jgi:hypothetical protein